MLRRHYHYIPGEVRPEGCDGWWHYGEKVLLHGARMCPVHDRPESDDNGGGERV